MSRINDFRGLEELAKTKKKVVAVIKPEDEEVLLAVEEAYKNGIADFVLIGDKEKISEIIKSNNDLSTLNDIKIIDEKDPIQAGYKGVELIHQNQAHVYMKGLIGTAEFLKPVLDKEKGLRTGHLLSHVAIFELETYPKLLAVTDVAVNIRPTLEQKVAIIKNAASVMKFLGIDKPKVAAICAVEKVQPEKMPCTKDAYELMEMSNKGELGDIIVSGPFALDVAVSPHAAKVKKLDHLPAAGDADIILADDIETGNAIYKTMTNLVPGKSAAIVTGAKAPIVLTSRSDTHSAKYYSIALATCVDVI